MAERDEICSFTYNLRSESCLLKSKLQIPICFLDSISFFLFNGACEAEFVGNALLFLWNIDLQTCSSI